MNSESSAFSLKKGNKSLSYLKMNAAINNKNTRNAQMINDLFDDDYLKENNEEIKKFMKKSLDFSTKTKAFSTFYSVK